MGPAASEIGRTVRYWRSDVYQWLEEQSSHPHRHPLRLATVGDERDYESWRASRSDRGAAAACRGERTTARQSGEQRNKTFDRKVDAERFLAGVENSKVDRDVRRPRAGEGDGRRLGQSAGSTGQTHLKPTTHERYAGILRKHIRPTWGTVRLANVSHADVQAWVDRADRTHSPATVRKIHRVLSLILDMAVKDGRLARNVADGGQPAPRRSSTSTAT